MYCIMLKIINSFDLPGAGMGNCCQKDLLLPYKKRGAEDEIL